MKVSILFITYKHERFVAEAIRSAMGQDYPDIELVVCDDGSPDRTREILERELAECPPNIAVVPMHSERNVGLHANFNRGIAACTGDIIVPMSGDDISCRKRVSTLVREFSDHPNCMLVISNWQTIDEMGQFIPGSSPGSNHKVFSYGKKIKHIYGGAPVCGAAAAYRRCLHDTFGPMMKGHHAEDNCYWVRALIMGNIHYMPYVLVFWRAHDANLSNWSRSNEQDNRDMLMQRHIRFLRAHQFLSAQWNRDIGVAHEKALINSEFARTLFKAVRFDKEWQRIRRYSITKAPLNLWFGSARRIISLKPRFRFFRRLVLSQLKLRLSPRRRKRYWSDYFKNI